MAADAVTTSLVGLGVGALGVIALAAVNWQALSKDRAHGAAGTDPRQALLIGLFFTFLMGFLFAWALRYASGGLPVGGAFDGALYGGFLWIAFVLPVNLSEVAYEQGSVPRHVRYLGAWLVQLIVGGAIAGAVILA